jgi:D-glycero-alpha-D-manno-heptose-7-phosphate kinase
MPGTGVDSAWGRGKTAPVPAAPTAREVCVEVPVRACDVGGWTDTWFAGHGRVCNLAVGPGVTVRAGMTPGDGGVRVHLADYGVAFRVGAEPPEHRMIAEAVREAGAPPGADVRLRVTSAVPAASSLGTSASICVGVLAALDALGGRIRRPGELAGAAHRVETERLGRQSGVQDQIAAAHGGPNAIRVVRYPDAEVLPLDLDPGFARGLQERLLHVAYGAPHDSSAVHDAVIAELEREGPSSPRLERLRRLAEEAAAALVAGELDRYARSLTAATEVQAALHPALVSDDARELIDLARSLGAAGWKVNGAGGSGGSISILCRSPSDRERLLGGASRLGHTPLSLSLSPAGARVVEPTADT